MLTSAYSESDGRLHRARKAIRKIVALGLSKDELLELYIRIKERRPAPSDIDNGEPGDPDDRDERRRLAQEAIRTLVRLGFAECDIAYLAGLAAATITKTLDPLDVRAPKAENVQKLLSAVERAGGARLNALLPRVPVKVVDTCCNKGLAINPTRGDELETGVRHALSNVLLGLAPQNPLASGVYGALYELGEQENGVVVAVAPRWKGASRQARLSQLKALEHEIQHLQKRFAEERHRIEKELRLLQTDRLPSDGKFA